MPIASGAKLGPYEVLDAIGAGGMGEVYRARDAKLGRLGVPLPRGRLVLIDTTAVLEEGSESVLRGGVSLLG